MLASFSGQDAPFSAGQPGFDSPCEYHHTGRDAVS